MVKQWKLMPLTLSVLKDELNGLHCTSCYLAQGAGGGEMQFQVTLHDVAVSNTQPQIFPRYLINRDPGRLVLLPAKKKEIPSWVWMERAHANTSGFRWDLGLRSYVVLKILLQCFTVLFVSLRSKIWRSWSFFLTNFQLHLESLFFSPGPYTPKIHPLLRCFKLDIRVF